MDDTYNKLRNCGKNSVDILVQWMKDARVLEEAKEAEDEAKRLFDDVADKTNVGFEKFMQVLERIAVDSDRTTNELVSKLENEGPKLLNAFEAAVKAFKDALK